ncbi:c-type cytochrome [Caldovatus aquaticus]|uniref:Cytochrome c n=1 Tax=Caldovatus aquaticus TaxID=2865671 RepID=A0ABS7EYR9_9PROT|nr:cytochrome c [Caldovatus aquaticus]MBW8268369.1 cytochrome c [Caldovatus aquaticus]
MTRTTIGMLAVAGAAVAAAATLASAPAVQAQSGGAAAVIRERQEGFRQMNAILRRFRDTLQARGEVRPLASQVDEMLAYYRTLHERFPPGSDTGAETWARPEVWSNRPLFEQRAAAMLPELEKLKAAAASGDAAATGRQLQAVGAACTACHDSFRRPRS